MLIRTKQANLKSAIFVTIGIFLDKGFNFQPNVFNGCYDLSMMSMNLSDITTLNIKRSNYHVIISEISKIEAMKLKENIDLTEKRGTL